MTDHAYKHLEALIGKRIRLTYTNDPYTNLRRGDTGTVNFVDDTGTVFANWESGSRLGLNASFGDRWEVVE